MPHPTLPILRVAALAAVIAGGAIALPAAATDRVVVVRPGDTLSQIALDHGVSVARLRALNGIADPNRIYVGQRLRLSGPSAGATAKASAPKANAIVHVVAWGETLTRIARRYRSTIAAIVNANALADPSYLRVGQRLTIPGTSAPTTSAEPTAKASSPTAKAIVHVVAWGETLTGIAHRYRSTIAAIVQANALADPSYLRVGQRLTIPGTSALTGSVARSAPLGIRSLMAARADIGHIIRAEATSQQVPIALALAVAWQESGWRADVVSRAGAVGVMQLTPATADWVATTMLGGPVRLDDARSNVRAGVALLRHYLDRYHGDQSLVLAAYYQGQTAADRYGVYAITRPYISSILALEKLFAG